MWFLKTAAWVTDSHTHNSHTNTNAEISHNKVEKGNIESASMLVIQQKDGLVAIGNKRIETGDS